MIFRVLNRSKLYYFFVFIFLISCQVNQKDDSKKNEKPNIIWINAEDISPVFGCYGDKNAITPNIDSLAAKGIVFKNVFTTSPICSPSRSSFISGIHSTSLGSQHLRSNVKLPQFIKTLPQILKEEGYFTSIYGKTDYNFDVDGFWSYWADDEKPWQKREKNQPFFSTYTFGFSHEGRGNDKERYLKMRQMLPKEYIHDSLSVTPPIYFPNNNDFKNLWTRYYDLVSLFDLKVGEIINHLKEDNLLDNTIIFIFSDHGFGMPRYKRWLYNSGIHVPLVVYCPKKYREQFMLENSNNVANQKISFIDFAPTVLSLANANVPSYMQGRIFLGDTKTIQKEPEVIYASRSRADNAYDMSRAVRTNKFIYIRNFMPYLPYIQEGKIFSDDKESFKLLRAEREKNKLAPQTEAMFQQKNVEELFDLENDPYELNNLVNDKKYDYVLIDMRNQLKEQAIKTRDIGYLHEIEFNKRSEKSTPFEVAKNNFDIVKIFDAANLVGFANEPDFIQNLKSTDSGIRYWALVGLRNLPQLSKKSLEEVEIILDDSAVANQILSAEIVLRNGQNNKALTILKQSLLSDNQVVSLAAARTLELLGKISWQLKPEIYAVLEKYKNKDSNGYPYTDYNYASFISWSLEEIVKNNP